MPEQGGAGSGPAPMKFATLPFLAMLAFASVSCSSTKSDAPPLKGQAVGASVTQTNAVTPKPKAANCRKCAEAVGGALAAPFVVLYMLGLGMTGNLPHC